MRGEAVQAWSTLLARARTRHVRVVARRNAHVDDAHGALAREAYSFLYRGGKLGDLRHRANSLCALRARHHRDIDVGPADALADPAVLDRPGALLRDALLVQLVVEEGAVVGDQDETGDAVVRRRPQRRVAHEEIAVAHDRHGQPAAAFQGKRCAHGDAGSGSDAASALGADVVERMMEVTVAAVPAERKPRHAYVLTLGRGVQR